MTEELTRGDTAGHVTQDWGITVCNLKVKGSLGCSVYLVMDFKFITQGSKISNRMCLETFLKESPELWSKRGVSRRVDWFSRITSLFKSSPSQWAGSQAKVKRGLSGWTQSSLLNKKIKKKYRGGQTKGRWCRRKPIETLSECAWKV